MAATKTKKKATRKPPRAAAPKLTAKQRAQDKNPLYNPVQQLAGHRLSEAADALVGAEYGPKLAALGREARSTETQDSALAGRAGDYYRQLAESEAAGVARQKALSAAATGAIGKVGADSQAALEKTTADEQARQAADAALRGGGLSGGSNVLGELAAAKARASEQAATAQTSGAEQNANYEGLMNTLAAARALRGGEVQGELANRQANDETKIRGARSDLEAARGDERVKQLLGLRQQGYENIVTQQGLGLKQSQLQADVENQTAQQQLAAARIDETSRSNRSQEQAARGRIKAQLRGQDLSHEDRQAAIEQRRQAAANKKAAAKGKEPAAAVKTKRAIQNTILAIDQGHSDRWLAKQGVAPDVLQAAKDIKKYGHVLNDTLNMLLRLGMDVPKEWQPPAILKGYGPH